MEAPDTRQYPLVAIVEFSHEDFVDGVGQIACQLPQNAIVTGGGLIIDTAFDSVTTDAMEVGDSADADRYLASTSVQATGYTALVPTGFSVTEATKNILLELTSTGGGLAAGAGRLIVEYVVDGRGNENFG